MPKKKMKLFVWPGVLTDWSSGIAFALAESPEEAKAILVTRGLPERHWQGTMIDGVEPQEFNEPCGFFVFGGG